MDESFGNISRANPPNVSIWKRNVQDLPPLSGKKRKNTQNRRVFRANAKFRMQSGIAPGRDGRE
jgi:hypothetical protein